MCKHSEATGIRAKSRIPWLVAGAALAAGSLTSTVARAHGFEAGRFFPPTIQTDDPFATDELSLPTVEYFQNPGTPATKTVDSSFEFDKELFPKFAVGISDGVQYQSPDGLPSATGFDNLELSAKYQLWEVPEHEWIFSVGAIWDVGGTGSKKIGATTANTFTPTIYFGKGMGDIPDSLDALKPLAVTGTFGVDIPTQGVQNALETGVAVEYSLPYLQSQVKDIGLPEPFKSMIPLVEFAFTTPINRGYGPTTGTINPGVLYETQYFQLGAEAVIPANSPTGSRVGAVVNVQIFLDDIFPQTFGHPLFGGKDE
ncbi:MAG: hypothetical protein ABSH19_07835 [Opitutales bacterium]